MVNVEVCKTLDGGSIPLLAFLIYKFFITNNNYEKIFFYLQLSNIYYFK